MPGHLLNNGMFSSGQLDPDFCSAVSILSAWDLLDDETELGSECTGEVIMILYLGK
jgi:hypothetical protein